MNREIRKAMKVDHKFTEKYLSWMKLPEQIQDLEPTTATNQYCSDSRCGKIFPCFHGLEVPCLLAPYTYYKMSWPWWCKILSQISWRTQKMLWRLGIHIHNPIRGECTPDFSCCRVLGDPMNHILDALVDAAKNDESIVSIKKIDNPN